MNLVTTSVLKLLKSFRWNIFYWFLHILFVVFFIIRGIVVSNTPEAVHIPRIEYVNEINIGDEHYQFMNRSEILKMTFTRWLLPRTTETPTGLHVHVVGSGRWKDREVWKLLVRKLLMYEELGKDFPTTLSNFMLHESCMPYEMIW